ncbi:MAG: bis-aminopropyl spermidine synthase family protein [Candidatus Omnitrophica bacterium]|nr:bis-aminopropyl spermidine synthase family protein [Candidatus Omnitrophota bacterium]
MNPDTDDLSLQDLCEVIATLTDLHEGPEGVETLVRIVYENQPIAPRDVARKMGLPIPLVSAIRREFEKEGWMLRKGGMVLSPEAEAKARTLWGKARFEHASETVEPEQGPSDFLDRIVQLRPSAERSLDQSHATRKTLVNRANHFIEEGLIQGKRVLFLGDDDLTSLATLQLLREKRGKEALGSCEVTVLELDERLVELIKSIGERERFPIRVEKVDLREKLPQGLAGQFDFFFTDPPYTPAGAELFLDRGCEALRQVSGVRANLAIPLSPPALQMATQEILLRKGFFIDYLLPAFNHYLGATMQGGVSALYGLTLRNPNRFEGEGHTGPLYTREVR